MFCELRERAKNGFLVGKKTVGGAMTALVALLMLGASSANAALSTEIATAFTEIQTDALSLIDLVWPVVAVVTGGFVMFKIFKRGASKI